MAHSPYATRNSVRARSYGQIRNWPQSAAQLRYQYESKDRIKEALFDTAPRSTWNYGWYEAQAKQRFFRVIEQLIANNTDSVIESNFIGKDKVRLKRYLKGNVYLTEIYCSAQGLTSFRRFVSRSETGRRHKGHHDRRWYPKVFLQDCLRSVGSSGHTDR